MRTGALLLILAIALIPASPRADIHPLPGAAGHPRLYFTPADLPALRAGRRHAYRARIWRNIAKSADWCLTRKTRTEWIAPITPDPIYLNLYDRFYAMMQDMAIMEHLSFAYAYSGSPRYFEGARRWSLACSDIWRHEADGTPDANKAYAAMRLLKGLAVSYDLLYDRLSDAERARIRATMLDIGGKYYQWYLENPTMAGPGQDKHHGSVECASFGVAALSLLGEVPAASGWLDLAIRKHTEYLLPSALTPSGTQEQSHNFWASTMQYRIFFLDALRRVTGQDLFRQFEPQMTGRVAMAAVACRRKAGFDEEQQSILFAPSYGQLNYWSPVLLYLAREYRRPIYQRLALWESEPGAIQKTRYVTSHDEWLLFTLGAYAYTWYDPSVGTDVDPREQRSFAFPEVGEAYARASYTPGGIVAGLRRGSVIVHAGGHPLIVDLTDPQVDPAKTPSVEVADTDTTTTIHTSCEVGAARVQQSLSVERDGLVTWRRTMDGDTKWWCWGRPRRTRNMLVWPDGSRLTVRTGDLVSVQVDGYRDEKIVGMGKLKLVDPMPTRYTLVVARPTAGELVIEVSRTGSKTVVR